MKEAFFAAAVMCFVGVGCADGDAPPVEDPVEQQPFASVLGPGQVGVVTEPSGEGATGDEVRIDPIGQPDNNVNQMLPAF